MVRGRFEFDEMKQWVEHFKRAANEKVIEAFIHECLIELANKFMSKVKRKTPVNTGLLRNSWQISSIEKHGDSYVINIYTDIEYAKFVENGFRAHWVPGEWKSNQFVYDPDAKTGMYVGEKGGWVEGKFMMRISKKEIERELPRFIARKQKELLKRIMNGG